jgi:hypothetical protein
MKAFGKTGAKAVSWDEQSYRPRIKNMMRYAKTLNQSDIFDQWIVEVLNGVVVSDEVMSALKSAFVNAYQAAKTAIDQEKAETVVSFPPPAVVPAPKKTYAEIKQEKAIEAETTKQKVAELKAKVLKKWFIRMNTITSNGKPLSELTNGEVVVECDRQSGAWLALKVLAAKLPSSEIFGESVNEDTLAKHTSSTIT